MYRLTQWLRPLAHLFVGPPDRADGAAVPEDPERGDVPGWVLITLMTAALVVAIWGVAGEQLLRILNEALDRVSVI